MTRNIRFLRTNAIALVALFFALGGSAVAAGGLITGDKIASETITGTNIKDGAVTGADVAYNSITGVNIADQSVGFMDIAKDSISGHQITDGTVQAEEIGLGTVSLAHLNRVSTTTTAVGLIAPDACKSTTATGLPQGALTLAMATTPNATAAASSVNASGTATVTVCNHAAVSANPGFKLYAIRS